jgi:hypothetical protein
VIDSKLLLSDLQRLGRRLEADLHDRVESDAELRMALTEEYAKARDARRTAKTLEDWLDEQLTQGAVARLLGCVFVRFLEDNELIDPPRLAGAEARLQRARDEQAVFFQHRPEATDREYLEDVFAAVGGLPAASALFDRRTNPLWRMPVSGDAARDLLDFWRRLDEHGELVHDFRDPDWDTRFLGDLYQDLSEAARKQYALLQTPEFVEEFILDRTLEPAIDKFGLAQVSLIDPACGSGHFLLGAFERLLDGWQAREPRTNVRELVRRVLLALHGIDLNPFAVAIARFRLVVAALRACDVRRLADAPDYRLNLAVGDSLLHGARSDRLTGTDVPRQQPGLDHAYATEDADEVGRILDARYEVVVGNPPYITPKDTALNAAYRERWSSCSGKYALSVPFIERLLDLASSDGYVGQITSNSFMKREFGKRLVEQHIPRWDLTHVIDTSGAYIPGHGTPTVILIARARRPLAQHVRAVMGIRAEVTRPSDPASGAVWRSIVEHVDRPGAETDYVSVGDVPRQRFHKHPWTLGGGGAAELKVHLDQTGSGKIADVALSIGFMAITGEDEIFAAPREVWRRRSLSSWSRPFGTGDAIRDWAHVPALFALFPYDERGRLLQNEFLARFEWPFRTTLLMGKMFGETKYDRGREPLDYAIMSSDRERAPLLVAYAFVATHNHFVVERRGKVLKQSAPVIKVADDAAETKTLELAGVLNSSLAAFWIKNTMMNRGGGGIGGGLATEAWERFYEHDAAKLGRFPLSRALPVELARRLDELATELSAALPEAIAVYGVDVPGRAGLDSARREYELTRAKMVALQEELDWQVYGLYGLAEDDLTLPPEEVLPLALGERAFEIVLAQRMAAGEVETTWFERHASKATTEFPVHWPAPYRRVIERRIELIERDRNIGLIERPEYKRRWASEPWEVRERRALRMWLLDRLEDRRYWPEPKLVSAAHLADQARRDPDFVQVAGLLADRPDFDLTELVSELVVAGGVPYLAALRYKDSGLRKRRQWEGVWELQREEDAIDALTELPEDDPRRLTPEQATARKQAEVGEIPVPPRYVSGDFRKSSYWQQRGKLDVPKERFILYLGTERSADPTPVLGWAGWNHREQALAMATFLLDAREREGFGANRLTPLLAGLLELVPWLHQWHGERDPELGESIASYIEGFLDEQLRELHLTRDDLGAWRVSETGRRRRRAA